MREVWGQCGCLGEMADQVGTGNRKCEKGSWVRWALVCQEVTCTDSDESGVTGGGGTWGQQPVSGVSEKKEGLWQIAAAGWELGPGNKAWNWASWVTLEMRPSLISPGQVCAVRDFMSAAGGSLPHVLAEVYLRFASYACTAMYLSRPSLKNTGAAIFTSEFFLWGPDCMSDAWFYSLSHQFKNYLCLIGN